MVNELAYFGVALLVFWGGLAAYLWRLNAAQARLARDLERLRGDG